MRLKPRSADPTPGEIRRALADTSRLTAQDLRDMPGIVKRFRDMGLLQFSKDHQAAEALHRRKE